MGTETASYFAKFNLFTNMAHFVGKQLHIRPNEILDTWCVPELIVAYGQYMNEIADQNYREYEAMKRKTEPPRPRRYFVRFMNPDELEENDG